MSSSIHHRDASQSGSDAGAKGDSSKNSITLSTGGMIAIVVVVVVVTLIGVSTATLFFIAKKREWRVRETIRQSARKVAAALTPRRAQFPDSVKRSVGGPRPSRLQTSSSSNNSNSRAGFPRASNEDLEKGYSRKSEKTRR